MQVNALYDWIPLLFRTMLERNGRQHLLMRKGESVESLSLLMTRVLLADHVHASLSLHHLHAWWDWIVHEGRRRGYLAALAEAFHRGTDFHSMIRSRVLMKWDPILQWRHFGVGSNGERRDGIGINEVCYIGYSEWMKWWCTGKTLIGKSGGIPVGNLMTNERSPWHGDCDCIIAESH